jgi:hypothetical protein
MMNPPPVSVSAALSCVVAVSSSLNAFDADGHRWRVVNKGIPGYTSCHIVDRLAADFETYDPDVLIVAVGLLPLAACFQLFDGAQVVCFGVLRGAGDTRVPPLFNLLGYWALGIPVGYFLGFKLGWGPEGIWIGLILALMMVSVMLLFRVRVVQRRGGARVVVQ